MGKYLKMADVFDLPILGSRAEFFPLCLNESSAMIAAHAINSHDELVAEVEMLRGMVIRMQTYLDMAGEYPEKESGNPVRRWLFDAIDCAKQ